MILEAQLENKLIEQLSSLSSLSSGVQFIGSRQIGIADDGGIIDKDDVDSIVAIHTGYRSHDAFSLSPISVTVGLTITTRQEKDVTGTRHEEIVETISNQLSYWHFYSDQFTSTFQLPNMFCGELRSSGGSGRKYDDKNEAWIDTLTFTIRGSEIFQTPIVPVWGEGKYIFKFENDYECIYEQEYDRYYNDNALINADGSCFFINPNTHRMYNGTFDKSLKEQEVELTEDQEGTTITARLTWTPNA